MKKYTIYPKKQSYVSSAIQDPTDEDIELQVDTAGFTSDTRILRRLAKSPYWRVLQAVASNPATPTDILADLAEYSEAVVAAVAANPNTSVETLDKIARSKQFYASEVKLSLAMNPNTPQEILHRLEDDYDRDVRAKAFANLSSHVS